MRGIGRWVCAGIALLTASVYALDYYDVLQLPRPLFWVVGSINGVALWEWLISARGSHD